MTELLPEFSSSEYLTDPKLSRLRGIPAKCELHFLPAHSGHHLNPIEGFWRRMKEGIGAGRCFESLHQLYQRPRQVLRAHQERPIYEFSW
jgi:hypothetical protein